MGGVRKQLQEFVALALAAATLVAPHRASAAPGAPGHVVTNPAWIRRPSGQDVVNYWPAKGVGIDGEVSISCVVTDRGTLDKCGVVSEKPAGDGFGNAALALSTLFLMKPRTVDGVPVGGATVNVPIHFMGGYSMVRPSTASSIAVYGSLPWSATPTAKEVSAAFPARAMGHVDRARVVLRCRITAAGGLRACEATTEQPGGYGFGGGARKLAALFRVADDPDIMTKVKDAYVDVPFDFRDPGKPPPPLELFDPQWRPNSNPPAAEAFPHEAVKDGLKTGIGLVRCRVTHAGTLTDCAIVGEQPANEGFGRLALGVARGMTMNPWSKQGLPVDDAEIRMPIRFNLEDAPATPGGRP